MSQEKGYAIITKEKVSLELPAPVAGAKEGIMEVS